MTVKLGMELIHTERASNDLTVLADEATTASLEEKRLALSAAFALIKRKLK